MHTIFKGAYTEMGFFQVDDNGTHTNEHAWNQVANMLCVYILRPHNQPPSSHLACRVQNQNLARLRIPTKRQLRRMHHSDQIPLSVIRLTTRWGMVKKKTPKKTHAYHLTTQRHAGTWNRQQARTTQSASQPVRNKEKCSLHARGTTLRKQRLTRTRWLRSTRSSLHSPPTTCT